MGVSRGVGLGALLRNGCPISRFVVPPHRSDRHTRRSAGSEEGLATQLGQGDREGEAKPRDTK